MFTVGEIVTGEQVNINDKLKVPIVEFYQIEKIDNINYYVKTTNNRYTLFINTLFINTLLIFTKDKLVYFNSYTQSNDNNFKIRKLTLLEKIKLALN